MVQTLEAIKGGGGSVKVGTTGTISALMSREIESSKSISKSSSLSNAPRKQKSRTSIDEASSSSSSSSSTNNLKNDKLPETTQRKTKQHHSQIPMLSDDNISVDGTPIRPKPVKKGPVGVVEIVDIKCGSPDKNWVNPITNRLKKLGFSKLSDNVG